MIRLILSVVALILIIVASAGCVSRKKEAYREKKGLMLLETSQLGRNKGYYSKHRAKHIDHNYKKILKKRKYSD